MTLLPELERLAREAEHEAATSDKCDRWDAFAMAMADSAPLLLAAVRAAEAYVESEGDITFEALRAALDALKGST